MSISTELLAKVILIPTYSYFFYNNFVFLSADFRFSVLLLATFNLMLTIIILTRRAACKVSLNPSDIIITMFGTYAILFTQGVGSQQEILALQVIGGIGIIISFTGLITLNKSFGLLPADRGIVSNGIYQLVRHPIYAGYFISNICFLCQNYSPRNLMCFSLFAIFESWRILREENLLMQNTEYAEYAMRTRWRIIPWVW